MSKGYNNILFLKKFLSKIEKVLKCGCGNWKSFPNTNSLNPYVIVSKKILYIYIYKTFFSFQVRVHLNQKPPSPINLSPHTHTHTQTQTQTQTIKPSTEPHTHHQTSWSQQRPPHPPPKPPISKPTPPIWNPGRRKYLEKLRWSTQKNVKNTQKYPSHRFETQAADLKPKPSKIPSKTKTKTKPKLKQHHWSKLIKKKIIIGATIGATDDQPNRSTDPPFQTHWSTDPSPTIQTQLADPRWSNLQNPKPSTGERQREEMRVRMRERENKTLFLVLQLC